MKNKAPRNNVCCIFSDFPIRNIGVNKEDVASLPFMQLTCVLLENINYSELCARSSLLADHPN